MDVGQFLRDHGIVAPRHEHPAVMTVEESLRLVPRLPGAKTKNLFLRDKRGRRHFLVTVRHDTAVDLDALGATLGVGGVGFASAERLQKYLGIKPGSVSLLALVNDQALAVEFVIDRLLWEADAVHAHPLVNTATMVIAHADLERFLAATRHVPRVIDVPVAKDRSAPFVRALIICAGQSNVVSGFVERTAKTREEIMKRIGWRMLAVVTAAMIAVAVASSASMSRRRWSSGPTGTRTPTSTSGTRTKGKSSPRRGATRSRWSPIPYQGYEAKYLAAFMAKSSAPDIFMGMTHQWCGQYDFCDKMPADLAKTYDDNLPKYMVEVGKWKGVRYGIPIEHGNFQQMYINVDMFKKAGLNPDDPPKTFDKWLADMKKLTIADPKGGEPTQVGFAIRSKGDPVGITDKFLPFDPRLGRPDAEPGLDKATGYANSPQMVAALTFFGDLVNKDKGRASSSAIPKMPSARNALLSSSASPGSSVG